MDDDGRRPRTRQADLERAQPTSVVGGAGTDVLTLEGTGDKVLSLTADGDQIRTRDESYVVLLYQGSPGPVEADLAAGTVRLVGAATGDVIIIGAPESTPFVLYGTDGDDLMSGNDYDDYMFGLAKARTSWPGVAATTYSNGGQGNDVIDGGDGDDYADGGRGSDICTNAENVDD